MNSYIVYIHTNIVNGKKYIGITSQTPNERWKNGQGYKGSTYFYNAIQKYGWNNFKHDIYMNNLTKEEACDMEIKLISEFKTNDERYGYNLDSGGSCGKHSDKTKEKLRNAFVGRKFSDETISRIKEAAKKRGGHSWTEESKKKVHNTKLGHKVSEETREKLKIAFSNPVLCIETNVIYPSITEAANAFNLSKCTISAALHGRLQTAGGFHWKLCDNN